MHDDSNMSGNICIEVPQVFDFCFQAEHRDICFPLPGHCCRKPVPTGSTAACTIDSVTCTEVSRVPSNTITGREDVTFLITVALTFTILNPDGTTNCSFSESVTFTKTVVLCAPVGTTTVCEVTYRCGPCVVADDSICCSFDLCLILKAVVIVTILVKATVLTPGPCVVPLPIGPLSCPPVIPTGCGACPPPKNAD